MSKRVQHIMVLAGTIALVFVANIYAFFHNSVAIFVHKPSVAIAQQCAQDQVSSTNPNQVLFVTCGGFIE